MAQDPDARRDVPAYVALMRITVVIGMSASIATGGFLLLAGQRYFLWGFLCIAMAVPFFVAMRFVERLAESKGAPPPPYT
jgi:hypothetical protein